MKMKQLLKSLASVFLALSSLNLHSSVSAFPKNFWKNFGDNFTLVSSPPHREIPLDDGMAFREPINILVIGEPKSGKSNVAALVLRNLRGQAPGLNSIDVIHDNVYVSPTHSGVRVVELNVEEFLELKNRRDRNDEYFIENISWVFYVCGNGKDDPKNLLRVYNKINKVYCRKYHVSYPYDDDCKASKQNSEWLRKLENSMGTYDKYCRFAVIANSEEGGIDEKFKNEVSYFLNGRGFYYVKYPNILKLPDELLDHISGLKNSVVVPHKDPWSHENYFSGNWSKLWRGIIKSCAQEYRSWPSEWWSYDHSEPEFLKNKLDKNEQDKNNEFWERDVPSALGTSAAFGAALAALYGTCKAIQVGGKAIANKLSGNNKNKNPEISKNKLQPQNFKPTKSSENKKKTF